MYIISTISEIIGLRAEQEHETKINFPNPEFIKYHKLITTVLKTNATLDFQLLRLHIEGIVGRPLKLVRWIGYTPDIRLLDTIDEAMGWLSQYVGLTPKHVI